VGAAPPARGGVSAGARPLRDARLRHLRRLDRGSPPDPGVALRGDLRGAGLVGARAVEQPIARVVDRLVVCDTSRARRSRRLAIGAQGSARRVPAVVLAVDRNLLPPAWWFEARARSLPDFRFGRCIQSARHCGGWRAGADRAVARVTAGSATQTRVRGRVRGVRPAGVHSQCLGLELDGGDRAVPRRGFRHGCQVPWRLGSA